MPTSTYKGYELQTTGSNVGTWGTTLNNSALSYIDQNVGGITTAALSASNIALSESDSRNAILRLTGTLLANVTITTYAQGFFFVENLTSGNFTVSIRNTSVATSATVPQGTRATLISDSTNGVRIASEYNPPFATGVSTLFFNTNAPTGWTKSTTHNNKALRIVSSSGGGSGGSTAFTSVFAARTILQANLPNVSLTTSSNGDHTHTLTMSTTAKADPTGGNQPISTSSGSGSGTFTPAYLTMATTGAHTHSVPLGGSGTAMDFAVQYVDAIICVKD